MRNRKFNCTEQELYAVCALGWETCSQNIDRFQAFKPKYTPALLKERRAQIMKVMNMRDHHQRSASAERSRFSLRQHVENCLLNWKKLKSHIREAWPKDEQDIMLKAAGQPYYKSAVKLKWEACASLLNTAYTFILDNNERLQANNNMAKGFSEEFNKLASGFAVEYSKYLDSVKQAAIMTTEKANANNNLYREMMNMFADARVIFQKEPAMLKHFTFDSVLLMVSGRNSAGIRGTVSNGQSPAAEIQGLQLLLEETGQRIETDADGSFRVSQLAAGLYTLKATAPGYKPFVMEQILVHTGAHTTVNVVMEREESR